MNPGKSNINNASIEQRKQVLRESINTMVGTTFFGQMFKIARNSVIKGEYGHGGRGEEVFGSMLDMELAQRMGRGMKNSLGEAIYERYVKYVSQKDESKQ